MTDSSSSLPGLLIDPVRLQSCMGPACGRFDVDSLAECASTSTLLLQRADQGAPAGTVIVADRQTAGRGSRGRSWIASPEASLTFSLLWRFAGGLERLSGLSLAVGVAVLRALEALGAVGEKHAALKWPNDILYGQAKLGGILIELQSEPESALAVIGIGLNLKHPPEFVNDQPLALPPAALDAMFDPLPDRHVLLAQLLIELAQVLDGFSRDGFAALREPWMARHAWQDKAVRLMRDGRVEHEGVCRGADVDGALLVETAAGVTRCLSGDVSLRAL